MRPIKKLSACALIRDLIAVSSAMSPLGVEVACAFICQI